MVFHLDLNPVKDTSSGIGEAPSSKHSFQFGEALSITQMQPERFLDRRPQAANQHQVLHRWQITLRQFLRLE